MHQKHLTPRWQRHEDLKLIEQFKAGASIPQLSQAFQRKPTSIRLRLLKHKLIADWRLPPIDPSQPAAGVLQYCRKNPISHDQADANYHANHATTAQERATICLRLLLGETEWNDGYERHVDNCFENSDGDAVCGWLIEYAEADPHINRLINNHSYMAIRGTTMIDHWISQGHRGKHRTAK